MWLTVTWLGQTEETLAVALGFISTACTGFFGILFSLNAYLAQLGCSGKGLGLPTGQGVLPSLRTGGCVWGVGGKWEEERKWEI